MMRRSSRSLPTPLVALAIGGGLALVAVMLGSCLLFGVLFLGVVENAGFLETGMRAASGDVDSVEDDDDAADDPPDAMAVEEPAQPQEFPPIVERLGPPVRRRPNAAGPVNDGRWQADLVMRRTAEARLFVLAELVDHWMNQLATAQRSRNADEQTKATQELEKVRRQMAAEYEHVNGMAWTPVDARSDADLLAERKALIDDLQTFSNPRGGQLSKQFSVCAAGQRRARVEELDAALGH
jgi:hypothetical protein